MKIKDRINLYTTVLFMLMLVIVNGAIYYTFNNMVLNSDLVRVRAETERAVEGISRVGTSVPPSELLRAFVPLNGMLQIINPDGSRSMSVTAPNYKSLRNKSITYYQKEVQKILTLDGLPHALVSLPIIWHEGEIAELQVIENLTQSNDMLKILRIVLMMVTLIAMIPLLISSRLLSSFISRPLSSMIRTMKEIQESGQFKKINLPLKSKDELHQMGETFNDMIDILKSNYEKQGQFITNASHELRTPLTIIESYASLLKRRGKDKPELFDESVQAIHAEAIRMKELIEQLLQLAKHDNKWNVVMTEFKLADIVQELTRSFQKAYRRDIKLYIDDDVLVKADQQKFRQLFYILMDNAGKYSEESIEVSIKKEKQRAVVEISDRGIGMSKEELEKVFEPFYRVDKARTRKQGGFGLGLSLAKEIAEVMGVEIYMESIEDHGTKVKLLFLLANSQ